MTEAQHLDLLVELARVASKATRTHARAILVHDSDVLELRLCREGQPIDSYSSQPDYFERVSAVRRRHLAGNPEMWTDLLSPDSKPHGLGEAMRAKAVFAEDTLKAFARIIGLPVGQSVTGFNSLQATVPGAHVWLAFKSKAMPGRKPRKRWGPPRLAFSGHPGRVQFSVGEYVKHLLTFHLHNTGGPSRGFEIRVSGEALSLFIPTAAAAWQGYGLRQVETPFAQVDPAPSQGFVARFPDFDLPATIASPEFPDFSGSPASVAQAMIEHDRALEEQTRRTVIVDIHGRGSSPGSGVLWVYVAPLDAPLEVAEQAVPIRVLTPV